MEPTSHGAVTTSVACIEPYVRQGRMIARACSGGPSGADVLGAGRDQIKPQKPTAGVKRRFRRVFECPEEAGLRSRRVEKSVDSA